MKPTMLAFALGFAMCMQSTTAGDTLYPNTTLYMNQYIESGAGNFRLIMQGDGNLVMYRKDGTPRWSTGARGYNSIMQWDGNFVLYSALRTSQWNTATDRNPGARLVVQDDGNLVIYAQDNRALWNIGTDTEKDPKHIGDAVGRDLDIPGLGWVGHIGIWDGKQVIEVVNGSSNAVRFQSMNQFKSASPYWGYAAPTIPDEPLATA